MNSNHFLSLATSISRFSNSILTCLLIKSFLLRLITELTNSLSLTSLSLFQHSHFEHKRVLVQHNYLSL